MNLRKIIEKEIGSTAITKVSIFSDFPKVSNENSDEENRLNFKFKKEFFNKIYTAQTKIIFLLNTTIYNPSYFPTQ